MPLVTVIIPTRERHELLARALTSVWAQTHRELEVIVVDDNEPANRVQLQPALASLLADERVNLLNNAGKHSAAAARNAGLAYARGDWVTFLDDDDTYRPDKIAAQLALATNHAAPLVLCGAAFHLRQRVRLAQCETTAWRGDDLILRARWTTPLLFHRRESGVRFDDTFAAGEDVLYAQALLAAFSVSAVPVVAEPIVEVYQDVPTLARTNLHGDAGWRAVRRTWWLFGRRYSPAARRLFVLRSMVGRAKLAGDARQVVALTPALLRAGGASQLRFALNAFAVGAGLPRDRFVT